MDQTGSESYEVISPELEAALQAVEAEQNARASAASNEESAHSNETLPETFAETTVNEAEMQGEMAVEVMTQKASSVGEAEMWEEVEDMLTQNASSDGLPSAREQDVTPTASLEGISEIQKEEKVDANEQPIPIKAEPDMVREEEDEKADKSCSELESEEEHVDVTADTTEERTFVEQEPVKTMVDLSKMSPTPKAMKRCDSDAGASAASVRSDVVAETLSGMGFRRCQAKSDGNCLLLSVMAGAEITPQEAQDPDSFVLEKVALLRRGAMDLLESEAPIDGIPKTTFWAGEDFEPATSDFVHREMMPWRQEGFWLPDTPLRVGTFALSVALFIHRPVYVLHRLDDGHYSHLSRVYGARREDGELKHTPAKPHAPETVPTYEVLPTSDLLTKLNEIMSTLSGLPADKSVLTVIEYNGINHFDPWLLPLKDARVGERVVVIAKGRPACGGWRESTGMVADTSDSGHVLVATDGGIWRRAQAEQLHCERKLPNDLLTSPVVCGFTWPRRASAPLGMLLGYKHEHIISGMANAYHAHIVKQQSTDEFVRTRSQGVSKDTTSEQLRTYCIGDWVQYKDPYPNGEPIFATVVRIAVKTKTATAQGRNMLVLLGTMPTVDGKCQQATLFTASPHSWHRVIPIGAVCADIDSIEAPVMRVSDNELTSLNKSFLDRHAVELPPTMSNASRLAYGHPPMLTEALKHQKRREEQASKARVMKAKAETKKTSLEAAPEANKVAKGKRPASASSDAPSSRMRPQLTAPAAAAECHDQKKKRLQAAERLMPLKGAAVAKPATRAETRAETRVEAHADAESRADLNKAMAERHKAEAEAQRAQAEADVARAMAEEAMAKAETVRANAEMAKARAEKVRADMEKAQTEARMALAEADKAKASEAASHSSTVPSQCAVVEETAKAASVGQMLPTSSAGSGPAPGYGTRTRTLESGDDPDVGEPRCASTDGTPCLSASEDSVRHWHTLFASALSPDDASRHPIRTPCRSDNGSKMPPMSLGTPMGPTPTVCGGAATAAPMQAPTMMPVHAGSGCSMETPSHHGACCMSSIAGVSSHPQQGYRVEMHTPGYGIPMGPPGCWMQQTPPGCGYEMQPNGWPSMRVPMLPYSYNQVMQPAGAHFVTSPSWRHREQRDNNELEIITPPDLVRLRRDLAAAKAARNNTLSTSQEYPARHAAVAELEYDVERRERQEYARRKRSA